MKTKERVEKYGEVFTAEREVNAMLDLVKEETLRIESRFLEPSCGDGNFLAEILRRKLCVVEALYANCQSEYEIHALLAISNLYGIDILQDNVQICRDRLFKLFDTHYIRLFGERTNKKYRDSVKYILSLNIIWGNTLDLKTLDKQNSPIFFAKWSLENDGMLKRRDYTLSFLISRRDQMDSSANATKCLEFIKEYPPVHFLDLVHAME